MLVLISLSSHCLSFFVPYFVVGLTDFGLTDSWRVSFHVVCLVGGFPPAVSRARGCFGEG